MSLPDGDITPDTPRASDPPIIIPMTSDFQRHLLCTKCNEVCRFPVTIIGCGCGPLCLECVDDEACCEEALPTKRTVETRTLREEIDELIVRCPGCTMSMKHCIYPNHASKCAALVQRCSDGCSWEGWMRNLEAHRTQCLFAQITSIMDTIHTISKSVQHSIDCAANTITIANTIVSGIGERQQRHQWLRRRRDDPSSTAIGISKSPVLPDEVVILYVAEETSVRYVFKVRGTTRLGRTLQIIEARCGGRVVLSPDCSLLHGGSVCLPTDSCHSLGLFARPLEDIEKPSDPLYNMRRESLTTSVNDLLSKPDASGNLTPVTRMIHIFLHHAPENFTQQYAGGITPAPATCRGSATATAT